MKNCSTFNFELTPLDCKETRYIFLKNEGTTAIRYQWLRFTPDEKEQRLLGDFSLYSKLSTELSSKSEDDGQTSSSSSLESLGGGTASFVYTPSTESLENFEIDNPTETTPKNCN